MAEVFTGELTLDDNWGAVERDGNILPASGDSVQRFIREQLENLGDGLQSKPGYFFGIDDTASNKNILLGFENLSTYKAWEAAGSKLDDTEYIISRADLNKAEPQPYDAVLLENKTGSTTIVSTDNTVKIRVKFVSTHYEPANGEMIPSPSGEQGEITVQRRTNSSSNWETKYTNVIESIPAENTVGYTELDLTEVLSQGFQEVQIRVTGLDTGLSTTWLRFNVTKTNLGVKFTNSWELPQTLNYMQLSYYITGEVAKTLNIKITGPGGNGERTYTESLGENVWAESSGVSKSIKIYDSNIHNYKVVTEGIHTVETWVSVDGTNIESEHIISNVLMIPEETTQSYIIIQNLNTNLINWTDQKLFDYALYNPNGSTMPIEFVLKDYNEDVEYLKESMDSATCGKVLSIQGNIGIESENPSISAQMLVTSKGVNVINPIDFSINNTSQYSPTEGADFIFSGGSGNNEEKNPAVIKNPVTGEIIPSTWIGFNFNNDGWTTDSSNNKCLRVLAGQTVEIDYNPFINLNEDSLTIEMSIATRNISNDSVPILTIARDNEEDPSLYEGWKMWPTKGIFKSIGCTSDITQDILFQEGVKTHIAINIIHRMYSYTKDNQVYWINLVRLFVNGVINREFAYTESTLGDSAMDVPRKIVFGNTNAGADLDVYNIRIYKGKLSSSQILQDYISSLSTTKEKDQLLADNDIFGGRGVISYEKVKDKYNTLLWKYSENEQQAYESGSIAEAPQTRMVGVAEGDHNDTKDSRQYGDLVIRVIKSNGELDTDRSGTINDMSTQGQGTSSMGYWKWNQRWQFQTAGKDKDKDGINSKYTSVFTAINPESSHNGKKAWQPFEGAPFAKRLDGKINWASPMQSHKIGSTSLYNDLWKSIIKSNEIMDLGTEEDGSSFTGTSNGYADCRVTVGQVPFMVFCQKNKDSEPEFYGMYTMGPSKGDKPTFGYNEDNSKFGNFYMIEGCDNGTPLVLGRVPWNSTDITMDSKNEVFVYNGGDQYELSMGKTEKDYDPNNPTIKDFIEWNKFVYSLNPDIHPFNGTYSELVETEAGLDTEAFYWVTKSDTQTGSNMYDLYRYDITKLRWVNAGIEYNADGTDYEVVNIKDQTGIKPTGTYDNMNQQFINARAEIFKNGIGKWFAIDDLQFTVMFLKLIAASDNWAKNTYIYNAGFTDGDGKLTSKWRFFQDDLDTIFSLDNSGYKVKPYYVEEHDKKESDNSNYFNSDTNALYCLVELAWPSELRAMMKKILDAMVSLGGTVMGCFEKYYNSVPVYFPKAAYNEIARLLYEDGYINQNIGHYKSTTNPLAQAVGDQLEAEREWQRLRSIYIASYASQGDFSAADGGTSAGALNFRSSQVIDVNGNTKNAAYEFKLTPHMWIYPSMARGGTSMNPVDFKSDASGKTNYNLPPRTKAGETVTFKLNPGEIDGNTQLYIRGIDRYSNIGDFGNIALNPAYTFSISGQRLEEFIATDDACQNGMPFRPVEIKFPVSGMNNIKKVVINGDVMGGEKIATGEINLSGLWRLEYVDLSATSATNVSLPTKSNIKTLILPNTLNELNLSQQPQLVDLTVRNIKSIKKLTISDCPLLDGFSIFNRFFTGNVGLTSLRLTDIDWVGVTSSQLNYILNISSCEITGKITMAENDTLDFNTKMALLDKFGDIDNPDNGLHVKYDLKHLSSESGVSIKGVNSIYKEGDYQYSLNYMSGDVSANDFKEISWKVSSSKFGTIDNKSGVFTFRDNLSITDKEERTIDIECNITRVNSGGGINTFSVKKSIFLYQLPANVGDYVYADGSYSSPADDMGDKTVVAVCFYAEPGVDADVQKRLAIGVEIASPSNKAISWGLREYYNDTPSDIADLTNVYTSGVKGDGGSSYEFYIGNTSSKQLIEDFNIPEFNTKYQGTAAGDIGWVGNISRGKLNTSKIISYRNGILTKNNLANPENWNGESRKSEYEYLEYILDKVRNDGVRFAYYPAASYCYSYEPGIKTNGLKLKSGEVLSNKFKSHNWFLLSFGEMVHLWYYLNNLTDINGSQLLGFKNVFGGSINGMTGKSTYLWSSTEGDSTNAYAASIDVGSRTSKYITGMGGYSTIGNFSNGKMNEDLSRVLPAVEF